MAISLIRQTINIPEGTKFYAAIGPYRSFSSSPEYIEKCFDTWEEALKYIRENSISEDGKSIFVKMTVPNALFEGSGYVEVFKNDKNEFWTDVKVEVE